MNRRDLIRGLAMVGASALCGCSVPLRFKPLSEPGGESSSPKNPATDLRAKSQNFENNFPDDICFEGSKLEMVQRLLIQFRQVQQKVGYGNFNILGMDDFFRLAVVSKQEKVFLEEIFAFDAKEYGFQGDKVSSRFTDVISKNDVEKIPHTGHYLRKGESLELYKKISKEVGSTLTLSSGVRGIAKQFHLFFEKGVESEGNMSKASRSLAPPGYSFHGLADFDVGRRGFGARNFTDDFAKTDEYRKLLDLGYVQIRYTESNLLGVRFEPWHIKIHSHA